MKQFNSIGSVILTTNINKSPTANDTDKSIKELKSLFLKLNNGKLNKEQKRCLTSLYNQLILLTKISNYTQ